MEDPTKPATAAPSCQRCGGTGKVSHSCDFDWCHDSEKPCPDCRTVQPAVALKLSAAETAAFDAVLLNPPPPTGALMELMS